MRPKYQITPKEVKATAINAISWPKSRDDYNIPNQLSITPNTTTIRDGEYVPSVRYELTVGAEKQTLTYLYIDPIKVAELLTTGELLEIVARRASKQSEAIRFLAEETQSMHHRLDALEKKNTTA